MKIAIELNVEKIEVSFSCMCPVIDHKLRYNIVKAAVDRRVDLQTTFDNVTYDKKFVVNNRTDAWKLTSKCSFKIITCHIRSHWLPHHINYKFVSVHLLTRKVSQWACENLCCYRKICIRSCTKFNWINVLKVFCLWLHFLESVLENIHTPPQKGLEFPEGGGLCKAKKFKEKCIRARNCDQYGRQCD